MIRGERWERVKELFGSCRNAWRTAGLPNPGPPLTVTAVSSGQLRKKAGRREFQRGVEEQLSEEDSDTHFNLGIAYKEMGLLPEAIREFQVSARSPELFVECCSMIGVCYMDQGMWSQAAEWYQKALGAPNLTKEAELALRYDLAASLESAGEVQRAMGLYQQVVELNPAYRDVSTRLDELSQQSGQVN